MNVETAALLLILLPLWVYMFGFWLQLVAIGYHEVKEGARWFK